MEPRKEDQEQGRLPPEEKKRRFRLVKLEERIAPGFPATVRFSVGGTSFDQSVGFPPSHISKH